uniref:Genome polyprotein n=1 Tax=Viviparous lizard hepacivirus TaxID=3004178 RepID=A0A9C7GWR5_9FLAV|nr:polyprotein [Viviparous lizard hepacivirus]
MDNILNNINLPDGSHTRKKEKNLPLPKHTRAGWTCVRRLLSTLSRATPPPVRPAVRERRRGPSPNRVHWCRVTRKGRVVTDKNCGSIRGNRAPPVTRSEGDQRRRESSPAPRKQKASPLLTWRRPNQKKAWRVPKLDELAPFSLSPALVLSGTITRPNVSRGLRYLARVVEWRRGFRFAERFLRREAEKGRFYYHHCGHFPTELAHYLRNNRGWHSVDPALPKPTEHQVWLDPEVSVSCGSVVDGLPVTHRLGPYALAGSPAVEHWRGWERASAPKRAEPGSGRKQVVVMAPSGVSVAVQRDTSVKVGAGRKPKGKPTTQQQRNQQVQAALVARRITGRARAAPASYNPLDTRAVKGVSSAVDSLGKLVGETLLATDVSRTDADDPRRRSYGVGKVVDGAVGKVADIVNGIPVVGPVLKPVTKVAQHLVRGVEDAGNALTSTVGLKIAIIVALSCMIPTAVGLQADHICPTDKGGAFLSNACKESDIYFCYFDVCLHKLGCVPCTVTGSGKQQNKTCWAPRLQGLSTLSPDDAVWFARVWNPDILVAAAFACDFTGLGELCGLGLAYLDYSRLFVRTHHRFTCRCSCYQTDRTASLLEHFGEVTEAALEGYTGYLGDIILWLGRMTWELMSVIRFTYPLASTVVIIYLLGGNIPKALLVLLLLTFCHYTEGQILMWDSPEYLWWAHPQKGPWENYTKMWAGENDNSNLTEGDCAWPRKKCEGGTPVFYADAERMGTICRHNITWEGAGKLYCYNYKPLLIIEGVNKTVVLDGLLRTSAICALFNATGCDVVGNCLHDVRAKHCGKCFCHCGPTKTYKDCGVSPRLTRHINVTGNKNDYSLLMDTHAVQVSGWGWTGESYAGDRIFVKWGNITPRTNGWFEMPGKPRLTATTFFQVPPGYAWRTGAVGSGGFIKTSEDGTKQLLDVPHHMPTIPVIEHGIMVATAMTLAGSRAGTLCYMALLFGVAEARPIGVDKRTTMQKVKDAVEEALDLALDAAIVAGVTYIAGPAAGGAVAGAMAWNHGHAALTPDTSVILTASRVPPCGSTYAVWLWIAILMGQEYQLWFVTVVVKLVTGYAWLVLFSVAITYWLPHLSVLGDQEVCACVHLDTLEWFVLPADHALAVVACIVSIAVVVTSPAFFPWRRRLIFYTAYFHRRAHLVAAASPLSISAGPRVRLIRAWVTLWLCLVNPDALMWVMGATYGLAFTIDMTYVAIEGVCSGTPRIVTLLGPVNKIFLMANWALARLGLSQRLRQIEEPDIRISLEAAKASAWKAAANDRAMRVPWRHRLTVSPRPADLGEEWELCGPVSINHDKQLGFFKTLAVCLTGKQEQLPTANAYILGTPGSTSCAFCYNGAVYATFHGTRARPIASPTGARPPLASSPSLDTVIYPAPDRADSLNHCDCEETNAFLPLPDGRVVECVGGMDIDRYVLANAMALGELKGASGMPVLCAKGHVKGMMVAAKHAGGTATAIRVVPLASLLTLEASDAVESNLVTPPPVGPELRIVPFHAPTGSGKTTKLPYSYVADGRRVLVLNPSVATTAGVAGYMQQCFNVNPNRYYADVSVTTGSRLSYSTYGKFIAMKDKLLRDVDVLICDECHALDATTVLGIGTALSSLQNTKIKLVLLATATPPGKPVGVHKNVTEEQLTMEGDVEFHGAKLLSSNYTTGRHLIFCTTKKSCTEIATELGSKGCNSVTYWRGDPITKIPATGDVVVCSTDALMSGYTGNFDSVTDSNTSIVSYAEVTFNPTIDIGLRVEVADSVVRGQRRGRTGRGRPGKYYYVRKGTLAGGVVPLSSLLEAYDTGLSWYGMSARDVCIRLTAYYETGGLPAVPQNPSEFCDFFTILEPVAKTPEVKATMATGYSFPLLTAAQIRLCKAAGVGPPDDSKRWAPLKMPYNSDQRIPLLAKIEYCGDKASYDDVITKELASALGLTTTQTYSHGLMIAGLAIASAAVLIDRTATLAIRRTVTFTLKCDGVVVSTKVMLDHEQTLEEECVDVSAAWRVAGGFCDTASRGLASSAAYCTGMVGQAEVDWLGSWLQEHYYDWVSATTGLTAMGVVGRSGGLAGMAAAVCAATGPGSLTTKSLLSLMGACVATTYAPLNSALMIGIGGVVGAGVAASSFSSLLASLCTGYAASTSAANLAFHVATGNVPTIPMILEAGSGFFNPGASAAGIVLGCALAYSTADGNKVWMNRLLAMANKGNLVPDDYLERIGNTREAVRKVLTTMTFRGLFAELEKWCLLEREDDCSWEGALGVLGEAWSCALAAFRSLIRAGKSLSNSIKPVVPYVSCTSPYRGRWSGKQGSTIEATCNCGARAFGLVDGEGVARMTYSTKWCKAGLIGGVPIGAALHTEGTLPSPEKEDVFEWRPFGLTGWAEVGIVQGGHCYLNKLTVTSISFAQLRQIIVAQAEYVNGVPIKPRVEFPQWLPAKFVRIGTVVRDLPLHLGKRDSPIATVMASLAIIEDVVDGAEGAPTTSPADSKKEQSPEAGDDASSVASSNASPLMFPSWESWAKDREALEQLRTNLFHPLPKGRVARSSSGCSGGWESQTDSVADSASVALQMAGLSPNTKLSEPMQRSTKRAVAPADEISLKSLALSPSEVEEVDQIMDEVARDLLPDQLQGSPTPSARQDPPDVWFCRMDNGKVIIESDDDRLDGLEWLDADKQLDTIQELMQEWQVEAVPVYERGPNHSTVMFIGFRLLGEQACADRRAVLDKLPAETVATLKYPVPVVHGNGSHGVMAADVVVNFNEMWKDEEDANPGMSKTDAPTLTAWSFVLMDLINNGPPLPEPKVEVAKTVSSLAEVVVEEVLLGEEVQDMDSWESVTDSNLDDIPLDEVVESCWEVGGVSVVATNQPTDLCPSEGIVLFSEGKTWNDKDFTTSEVLEAFDLKTAFLGAIATASPPEDNGHILLSSSGKNIPKKNVVVVCLPNVNRKNRQAVKNRLRDSILAGFIALARAGCRTVCVADPPDWMDIDLAAWAVIAAIKSKRVPEITAVDLFWQSASPTDLKDAISAELKDEGKSLFGRAMSALSGVLRTQGEQESRMSYSYIWDGMLAWPQRFGRTIANPVPTVTTGIIRHRNVVYLTEASRANERVKKVTIWRNPIPPCRFLQASKERALQFAAARSYGLTPWSEVRAMTHTRTARSDCLSGPEVKRNSRKFKQQTDLVMEALRTDEHQEKFHTTVMVKEEVFCATPERDFTRKPPRFIVYPPLETRCVEKRLLANPVKALKDIMGDEYGFQYTPHERCQKLVSEWKKRKNPLGFAIDTVCFDSRITPEDVRFEGRFFANAAATQEQANDILRLTEKLYMGSPMYNIEGKYVGLRQCRASGVFTTSAGNTLTCWVKVRAALNRLRLDAYCLVCGDDVVVITESTGGPTGDIILLKELRSILDSYGLEQAEDPQACYQLDEITSCSQNVTSAKTSRGEVVYFGTRSCLTPLARASVETSKKNPLGSWLGWAMLCWGALWAKWLMAHFIDGLLCGRESGDHLVLELMGNIISCRPRDLPLIILALNGNRVWNMHDYTPYEISRLAADLKILGSPTIKQWKSRCRKIRVEALRAGGDAAYLADKCLSWCVGEDPVFTKEELLRGKVMGRKFKEAPPWSRSLVALQPQGLDLVRERLKTTGWLIPFLAAAMLLSIGIVSLA